jgi:hypothetical protein
VGGASTREEYARFYDLGSARRQNFGFELRVQSVRILVQQSFGVFNLDSTLLTVNGEEEVSGSKCFSGGAFGARREDNSGTYSFAALASFHSEEAKNIGSGWSESRKFDTNQGAGTSQGVSGAKVVVL